MYNLINIEKIKTAQDKHFNLLTRSYSNKKLLIQRLL